MTEPEPATDVPQPRDIALEQATPEQVAELEDRSVPADEFPGSEA
jgi:hypothetical protein